jgi:hypothetical protein
VVVAGSIGQPGYLDYLEVEDGVGVTCGRYCHACCPLLYTRTGAGHAQVLFYYGTDHNWWLGTVPP